MPKQEKKRAICRFCNARCRIEVTVENNRLVEVKEDPAVKNEVWPPTNACPRLLNAKDWFYHPSRIDYPLKRIGEKGEGKWQQISWEQALDEVAAKMKNLIARYGPETVGSTTGTGRVNYEFGTRFLSLINSPNNTCGQGNICHGPRAVVMKAITGWWPYSGANPDSRLYILWGRAPEQSWASIWYHIRKLKDDDTRKLIVVDPRVTESAKLADIHLQLRPGTDAALALGLINVIIEEELYDKEFVAKYCHGFEQLKERAKEYQPERVSEITWLPAEKIRAAARLYAAYKPGSIITGMGAEQLENSAEYVHARTILSALVGNMSVVGGDIVHGPHTKMISANDIDAIEHISPEQKTKQIGSDRFKLFTWPGYDMIQDNLKRYWGRRGGILGCENLVPAPLLYRAILNDDPYKVSALITWDSNPLLTQSNTKLVYKALKKLDLYVVVDFMLTSSADLADYVFPTGSWLERPCIWDGYNNANFIIAGERALSPTIEGEYDHRDDYQFWRGLGTRFGQEWPWETMEELFDYRLAPLGVTFAEFMQAGGVDKPPIEYDYYKEKGFATPTGKIELYSTIFEKLGYDPLPAYREPFETTISKPELAKEYPYILITGGRHRPFFHTEFRQIDRLRKQHPDPLVQLHPQTAAQLGIAHDDWVWIETHIGRVRQKCQIFDGIDPRVIHAQHGWWFPELPGEEPWLHGAWESNINVCTNDDPQSLNPIMGGWPLRTFLCKVYKCKTWD